MEYSDKVNSKDNVTLSPLLRTPCHSLLSSTLLRGVEVGNSLTMWCAMLLILFSTITISVSFNRSSARTLKLILILSLTELFNHGN